MAATIGSVADDRLPKSAQVWKFLVRCLEAGAPVVLEIFERAHSADSRPRDAIDAAWAFARGGERGKSLRDTGWAAHKAARDADTAAAGEAARPAMCAESGYPEAPPGGGSVGELFRDLDEALRSRF